jgi:G:T-mismatch repair DNA endonuclease (very short patch repair protein)
MARPIITRKSQAMAILYRNLGALLDARRSLADVEDYCRGQGHESDPIASYLTELTQCPCIVGGTDHHPWVRMEYDVDRCVTIDLPSPRDFGEPRDESPKPITGSNRNRLAQPLWDALEAAGIAFRAEPSNVEGMPSAAVCGRKTAVFVRRCYHWKHSCKGGDEREHRDIVKNLQSTGWKVFTLWECQIDNGLHLPLLVGVIKREVQGEGTASEIVSTANQP